MPSKLNQGFSFDVSYVSATGLPVGIYPSVGYQVHFYAGTLLDRIAAEDINAVVVPPNIRELVDTLYEEKYGKNGGKHE